MSVFLRVIRDDNEDGDCNGDQLCHQVDEIFQCVAQNNLECTSQDNSDCHDDLNEFGIAAHKKKNRCTTGANYESLTDNVGDIDSFCDQNADCTSNICFNGVCRTTDTLICNNKMNARHTLTERFPSALQILMLMKLNTIIVLHLESKKRSCNNRRLCGKFRLP